MWTLISVSLALLINFYSPDIPKSKKIYGTETYLQRGFPFNYYEGESLTDEELNYRIRIIYLTSFTYLTITFTLVPVAGQGIVPFSVTYSERFVPSDSRTAQEEFLLNFRGGGYDISEFIIKILLIWTMSQNCKPTKGFQPKLTNQDLGSMVQRQPNGRITPKLQENPVDRNNTNRRGDCRANQKNQDGRLTKEQRRNLPHSDDVEIPEQNVIIRHGQAKYKIKNHGSDFGLPSKPNAKNWNKTERTAENIKDFKNKIKDLVLRGERIEGTYRKSEPDEYSAIYFYDAATRQNVIFKQETKEFVSAWILTPEQAQDLLQNKTVGDY